MTDFRHNDTGEVLTERQLEKKCDVLSRKMMQVYRIKTGQETEGGRIEIVGGKPIVPVPRRRQMPLLYGPDGKPIA